tara:strand:+ start:631 stop:813 length:183 start_codon:yes stop_codon:yes gene_type:complete
LDLLPAVYAAFLWSLLLERFLRLLRPKKDCAKTAEKWMGVPGGLARLEWGVFLMMAKAMV